MDCLRSLISTLDVVSDVGFRGTGFGITGTLWGSFLFLFLCSSCTIALVCWHCQEMSANFLNIFLGKPQKSLILRAFSGFPNFRFFQKMAYYTIFTPFLHQFQNRGPPKSPVNSRKSELIYYTIKSRKI